MAAILLPAPASGRIHLGERRVRLGDVTASGRLRLDALARYLQDVSDDHTRAAGVQGRWGWLVRRTTVAVTAFPRLGEQLELRTWCSGIGPRWAERRVDLRGDQGGRIDAATLWVHVHPSTGRAQVLPAEFTEIFAETAGERRISARLDHASPPTNPEGVQTRFWPQRIVDLDVLGHANNAVAWAALEEVLAIRRAPDAPSQLEVGFHRPIEPDEEIELRWQPISDSDAYDLDLWMTSVAGVHVSAQIRPLSPR